MFDLFMDPDTYIVYAVQETHIEGDVNFTMKYLSPATNKECILKQLDTYPFTEEIQNLDPSKYVYKNGTLLTRPYFLMSLKDSSGKELSAESIALQTTVTVNIQLTNPDSLFVGQMTDAKVKDRTGFLSNFATSQIFPIDSNGLCTFSISSNFPGITRLRVKDTNYLAYPLVTDIRFRQS